MYLFYFHSFHSQYQFGDIIVFPPRSMHGFKYSHYAIYVGDRAFPRKNDGEDIFERTSMYT